MASEPLERSAWNLFHNPYLQLDPADAFLLTDITLTNRAYLLIGASSPPPSPS